MRHSILHVFAAMALGAGLALSAAPVSAKTVKECNAEYAAQKDALKAAGTKKADFVASCRAEADAASPAAPAAAAPAPAPAAAEAPAGGKTAKECNAEYSDNKDAIKASGKTKKAFVADCRAGNETIPAAATPAAPMPAPAAAAPAPTAPTPAATAPTAPAPMAAKPGAAVEGGFASDAQAKAKCPTDTVVWVNTKSHVYHFTGTHDYGNTKQGTYMCEADAKGAGSRAAKNETHP